MVAKRMGVSRAVGSASLALLVSVSPLGLTPALAAGADAPAENVTTEIVVTATKRSENLQNVPISITAMGGEQLAQHQVASFDDYAKLLPSVSYQSFGPGQSQVNMRGITSGGDGVAVGPLPTVGVYLDEVPLTTIGNSVDVHIYDMARVEALSGPQGTLYGASSLAGTLRLIANKPKIGVWEGGVDVEGNQYGPGGAGAKLEGFLNIPISSRVAARVSAFYTRDGGFIDNTYATRTYLRTHDDGTGTYVDSPLTVNNAKYVQKNFNTIDSAGARAALKIDLDDNWTVSPGVIYQNTLSHGSFLYDPRAGDLQVHDFTPDRNRDDWYLASMTIQGKLSDWDVTYAGSYFERRNDNIADYSYFTVAYDNFAKGDPADYAGYTYLKDALGHDIDPTQVVHTHDKYTKASHELRISSPGSNPWRLTVGAFMQRQTDLHEADYNIPGVSNAVNPFSPQVRGAPVDDVYYTHINRVDRDYAMFAEGSYDLLANLTVTAGIRGFIADNTIAGFSGGDGTIDKTNATTPGGCAALTVTACPNVNKKYVEAGETHKLSLKWQATSSKMFYATYSTGFRPGGNNRDSFFNGHVQSIPPFSADTISNYELGWKTSWFDRHLYINGAVFREDWDQVQYSLPGILGIYYTVNAGKARSSGVEGTVMWKPAPQLTISGTGTYIDAKLVSDFGNQAPAGTRLPVTPKFKANANARYEMPLGAYKAFLQAGVNYQGGTTSYLATAGEEIIGSTAAFTTADFSAGLSKGPLSFTAFINNAFDERGILSKNLSCAPNICGAYARLYPTKPQQFGVRSSYRF